MEVALSPAAQNSLVVIAIFNVLLFAVLIGLVAGVMIALKKIQAQIQPVIDRVNPLLEEAKPIVANVNPLINQNVKPILNNVQEITHKASGIVSDIGEHVHGIAETGEQTVKNLTHRVEAAGQVVTDTVSKPAISAASIVAGISKAFSVFKTYQGKPSEGPQGEPVHANGNGDRATTSEQKL
jgi:uncharacterized protein YoxC